MFLFTVSVITLTALIIWARLGLKNSYQSDLEQYIASRRPTSTAEVENLIKQYRTNGAWY